MNPRFVWLDALIALAEGRLLTKGGETALAYHLPGVPNVVHVFDDLLGHGWIAPVDRHGRRYGLTQQGAEALRQGADWYRAQPTWVRLLRPKPGLCRAVQAMAA